MRMSKVLIAALVVALVAAVAAPVLAATLTPEQNNELVQIQRQIAELRKQMVDKLLQYGQITSEQAEQMKARIDARQKYIEENPGWFANCPCGGRWGTFGRFRNRF